MTSRLLCAIRRPASIVAGLCLAGCGGNESPTEPPPPDTRAPLVEIVFPVNRTDDLGVEYTDYDETGNGFLDLRVTWSDDRSGVDPSTLTIEVLGEVTGGVSGEDLSGQWTRHELTEAGVRLEETLNRLVRQGRPSLVVSVADSAGNRGADTLRIRTRYGDFHRSLRFEDPGVPTSDLTVCEDDERLYVVRGYAIFVFEANTFERIGRYEVVAPQPLGRVLCIPGDPIVYVASGDLDRFDRVNLEWVSDINVLRTQRMRPSRKDPNILWTAEWGAGVPVKADRFTAQRVGSVGFPISSYSDEFSIGIAVIDDDRKIYWERHWERKLLVGDPATGKILREIQIGLASRLAVSPDGRYVYVPVWDGLLFGLRAIDTETDEVTHGMTTEMGPYAMGRPFDVALNPDGDRMWIATKDIDSFEPDVENVASLLIDPIRWVKLQAFPRPVPPGTKTRWLQAAAFHTNGRLVFQARDDDIDVYIIR